MSAETALREALEAEWYNGNMTEGAYDRILAALSAHRVEPAPTLDVERAAIERVARLRDARDALDMATLWLHRTMDLPPRDSQAAASWERKARSGRVALAADTPPSDAPEQGAWRKARSSSEQDYLDSAAEVLADVRKARS